MGSGIQQNSGLLILGQNGSATGADQISITLTLNQPVATGSYTSGSDAAGEVQILYNDGPFSTTTPYSYSNDLNSNLGTVVITTLAGANVQGTFNGVLISGSATKTLTNGKFNLTFN